MVRWLTTKAAIWSYEEEIRILIHPVDFNENTDLIQGINKNCFHSVYLGNRIEEKDKDLIIQLCREQYPRLKLFKIIPDKNNFELMHEPIGL